jgi:hypothetical protein
VDRPAMPLACAQGFRQPVMGSRHSSVSAALPCRRVHASSLKQDACSNPCARARPSLPVPARLPLACHAGRAGE